MAVALDAISTGANSASAATTIDLTTMTVGSGTNRALLCFLGILNNNSTGVTVTWDPGGGNQSLALIGSFGSAALSTVYIFGLRNPASGNKTLRASWTTGNNCAIDAIAFTGVDQTSDATAFPNFNSATGVASSAAAVAITTDANSYVVGVTDSSGNDVSTMDHTTIHINNGFFGFGSNYSAGAGTSITLGGTYAGAVTWFMAGTSVAPPATNLMSQIWM